MDPSIEEITDEAGFREAYPVMHELRTTLDEDEYFRLLEAMRPEGYRLFAVRSAGEIVALAGIAVMTNFYDRRHVWVYDLITRASERSRGHGERLLGYIEEFARREGCIHVSLCSGVQRLDAHRFYEERMGYTRPSWIFKKLL